MTGEAPAPCDRPSVGPPRGRAAPRRRHRLIASLVVACRGHAWHAGRRDDQPSEASDRGLVRDRESDHRVPGEVRSPPPPSRMAARGWTLAALFLPILLPVAIVYARRVRRDAALSIVESSSAQRLIDRPVVFYVAVWLAFLAVIFRADGCPQCVRRAPGLTGRAPQEERRGHH